MTKFGMKDFFKSIIVASLIVYGANGQCPSGQYRGNNTCLLCDKSCSIQGQTVTMPCIDDHNIKCECKEGSYFKQFAQICQPCTLAKPGEIYEKNCSSDEDAKVVECPKDMYTEDHQQCFNCTKCANGDEIKSCSRSSDAICKMEEKDKSVKAGVIVATVLALILVAIACIVLYCRYRRRHNLNDASRVIENNCEKSNIEERNVETGNIEWEETDLAHLSYNCRKALQMLLAPKSTNDWRSLADALGIEYAEIRNLERFQDCVFQLLDIYNGFENASIPNLYKALESINRYDACKLLEEYQKVMILK